MWSANVLSKRVKYLKLMNRKKIVIKKPIPIYIIGTWMGWPRMQYLNPSIMNTNGFARKTGFNTSGSFVR
jgi:hypothetical protein